MPHFKSSSPSCQSSNFPLVQDPYPNRPDDDHRGGGAWRREGEASLPCLYSNNSIENTARTSQENQLGTVVSLCSQLTSYHKKQAHTLFSNVKRLIEVEAISPNHVGFLTLTFKDNLCDTKEVYNRFRSLNTNFLSKYSEFGHWISVKEQQRRGAWHFHLVVTTPQDIRTGLNFEDLEKRKYTSASPYLKQIWKDLREAMPKYGFGRSELIPIKSNPEAMGRYVGKYISKHMGQRDDDSKGVRLISYSKGWAKNSPKLQFLTPNSKKWRKKLEIFALVNGCRELYQLSEKLGPNWAYRYADDIDGVFANVDLALAMKDHEYESPKLRAIYERKEKRERYLYQESGMGLYKIRQERLRQLEKDEWESLLPILIPHFVMGKQTKLQEVPF